MRESTLERIVPRDQAIIVDSSFAVRGFVSWEKATSLVMTKDAYTLIPRDGQFVRSPTVTIERPLVVALTHYVNVNPREYDADEIVSKSIILQRDAHTCQYCFEAGANTVDHVIPKSRGGLLTWGNSVAACTDCNSAKADRTPTEAGLTWPVIPKTFVNPRRESIQNAIYAHLGEM